MVAVTAFVAARAERGTLGVVNACRLKRLPASCGSADPVHFQLAAPGVQRFASSPALDLHLHALVLDGV